MSKEIVFVILSALLLLQGCCGKPLSDTDPKSTDSSEENRDIHPKAKALVSSVFKELENFIDYTIKEGEKLLKDVVADISETEDKDNEEINLRIKNISNVVDKMEKLKKLSSDETCDEKWDIASDMFDIFEQYNMTINEDPTAEDKIIETYFEKHGIDAFKQNGRNKMIDGLNNLGEKYESFWNELSLEERNEFPKFHAWHMKFKEEINYEEKLDMIVTFFLRNIESTD